MNKNIGGLTFKNIRVREEYENNKKNCLHCGEMLPFEKRKNRFCCSSCMATFTQKNGGNKKWTDKDKKKLSDTIKLKIENGDILRTPKKIKQKKFCSVCKGEFEVLPCHSNRKFCSKKCGSVGQDKSNMGGYRPTAGRGKSGWYKGVFCNSSWELAWVIYSTDHGIKFERNTEGFEYEFEDKKHKYYPDFIIGDKSYVEVKGYNSKQWRAKQEQFQHTLEIIDKEKIKPYLDYSVEKYGKDFIKVYE